MAAVEAEGIPPMMGRINLVCEELCVANTSAVCMAIPVAPGDGGNQSGNQSIPGIPGGPKSQKMGGKYFGNLPISPSRVHNV